MIKDLLIYRTWTKTWRQLSMLFAGLMLLVAARSPLLAHGQEVPPENDPSISSVEESTPSVPSAPLRQKGATVTAVQVFSSRVELTLSAPVEFRRAYLRGDADAQLADRYYVNLFPATLDRHLQSLFNVEDGPMQRVRLSQFRAGMVRVVLDLRGSHDGEVRMLTDPLRLVIDVNGTSSPAEPPSVMQPEGENSAEEVTPVEPSVSGRPSRRDPKQSAREGVMDLTWRSATQAWSLLPYAQSTRIQTELPLSSFVSAPRAEARSRPPRVPAAPQLSFGEALRETKIATPDFTAFFSLPSLPQVSLRAAEPASAVDLVFFSYWSWERICQEVGCIDVRAEELPNVESGQETPLPQTTAKPEDSQSVSVADVELNDEGPKQVGGNMMHQAWLVAMGIGVLLSFLTGIGVMLVWNRRHAGARTEKSDAWETRMAYLEEAVNRAGVLNSSFFHSLEVAQKRLETLLSQADLTEQNLRRLIHHAAFVGDKPVRREEIPDGSVREADAFATAALLLGEGEEVPQVARALKLPLAQVRLLQELRQLTQASKQEKTADLQEKTAAPQTPAEEVTLLTDVLVRLNGTARNGMRLAQNGQSL